VTTIKVTDALRRVFAIGYLVSSQTPSNYQIEASQPDIAVLRGTYADFHDSLPETAILTVKQSPINSHATDAPKKPRFRALQHSNCGL
jgi:hypothetical protein